VKIVETASETPGRFGSLLLISFSITVLSFGLPFLSIPLRDEAIKLSLVLAFAWIGLMIFGFFKYRWRALWLLLGAPLVGYWPFVLYSIASACAHNIKNCP
jgi:hypothetical protein